MRVKGNLSGKGYESNYQTDTAFADLKAVDSLYVNYGMVMLAQRIKFRLMCHLDTQNSLEPLQILGCGNIF